MTRQGTVEASTCGGAGAPLLAQQIDGRLASSEFLRTAIRVYLDFTPSTYKALRDSGTFAFVALHIFSAAGRHVSAVAELLRLIKRL